MRALMILREDALAVRGGDVIQAEMTGSALGRLGWEVAMITTRETSAFLHRGRDIDLVHFVHLPGVTLSALGAVGRAGLPYVVSPIFWDTTAMWFDAAKSRTARWQLARSMLGTSRASAVYSRWQSIKRRMSATWRWQSNFLRAASFVLPNSEIELTELQRYYGLGDILSRRSIVVPNGVEAEKFVDVSRHRSRFRKRFGLRRFVLEVARVEPAKNQLGLIGALADWDIPIVFVGGGNPRTTDYYEQCRTAGAARGGTFFLGELAHEDVIGAYAAAAVHVLPSWRETPGLASLEAAAAGCRVVSTSLGSAQEYFGDHVEYCRPDNADSIKCAVAAAMRSSVETVALRSLVLSRYTWDQAAAATASGYAGAMRQRSAAMRASERVMESGVPDS